MAALAVIGVIGLATSLAEAGYSAANQPSSPNLSQETAQMAQIQAELLPELRQLQAEEELGGVATIPATAQQMKAYDAANQQLTNLQGQLAEAQNAQSQTGSSDGRNRTGRGNTVTSLQNQIAALQKKIATLPHSQTVDFAGRSQSDIQGQIAKALAQGQLDTERQFDPQFIASALAQEKQADPERFQARDALYKDIQDQIKTPPVSPVSNEVQRQVAEKVAAGSSLTPEEQAMLKTAVAQGSADRGGTTGVDFSRDLTTGFAGSERERANAGAGINWLASGETPGDIQYRQDQQNLSNLSSYISGQTPESQFGELSGAQRGASPISQAQPLPSVNQGAGQQGAAAGVDAFKLNIQQQLDQPNLWMAGLSTLLSGANAAGKSGWQPFANTGA